MNALNPWQKIIRAAKRGTGLRLTFDEVWQLGMDDAIQQAASQERAESDAHNRETEARIEKKIGEELDLRDDKRGMSR